jgi:uncharacterized membrane-anchored protein YjiN (DUF445 family)
MDGVKADNCREPPDRLAGRGPWKADRMTDGADRPHSPVTPAGGSDTRRRTELRRMKLIATALLLAAAAVYAGTLHGTGWLGYLNTTAEAAMVGAIADWFAVTALFRHPLGLPIPHTAIIPTRKDALGRNLEEFVATNFLAEDVVRGRVARAGVTRRLGSWLAGPQHAERVGAELANLARGALRLARDEQVVALVEQVVLKRLVDRPWGPPAGRLLHRIVTDRAHHRLVDVGVAHLHEWLATHEEVIVRLVLDRAPLWTPQWLDQRIAARAYKELVAFAADVRVDPEHRMRKALDDLLARFADDLQHDPATMARAEAVKEQLVAHPDVRAGVTQLWVTVRTVLTEAVDDPGSDLRLRLVDALTGLGHRLGEDPGLQQVVDRYLEDAAGYLVRSYRDEVVTVISETVQRWDAAEASRRIELHVGRDLQFIRINGTVVGGLAGLLIHTVTVLAS